MISYWALKGNSHPGYYGVGGVFMLNIFGRFKKMMLYPRYGFFAELLYTG